VFEEIVGAHAFRFGQSGKALAVSDFTFSN
jgi:hypothetical protein